MNKEEVLKMAREAGFQRMKIPWYQMYADQDQVIKFVDLVLEMAANVSEKTTRFDAGVAGVDIQDFIAQQIRALKTNNV